MLSCFQFMSSCTLINLDREDDNGIEKYMCKLYGMKGIHLLDLLLVDLYVLTSRFATDMYKISLGDRRGIWFKCRLNNGLRPPLRVTLENRWRLEKRGGEIRLVMAMLSLQRVKGKRK